MQYELGSDRAQGFNSIHNTYGLNGTNELVLLFIESDPNTDINHLNGTAKENTTGDWVTGHNYPIINEETLAEKYEIDAYPTSILLSKDKEPIRIMGGYKSYQ